MWYKPFVIQSTQHLVLISGFGLNFQLFVLWLSCTFQGTLHPLHLACLIKGNKAGYQSACVPKILKYNNLSNFFRASLSKYLNHFLKAESKGVCLTFWTVASLPFMSVHVYFGTFYSPRVIFVLSLHVDSLILWKAFESWNSLIASSVSFNLIWG